MQKYLFKIFYIGRKYQGFQRQPNGMAVENLVELAFIKANYIDSFSSNHYRGCSRTDAGANAIANTFTLDCQSEPNLAQINSFLPKNATILVYAIVPVKKSFNPRKNAVKHYNYFIPPGQVKTINAVDRIFEFEGTHNFSQFIKRDGAGEFDPKSSIESITVQNVNHGLSIDFFGSRFGREQIRRMIGFLLEKRYDDELPSTYLTAGEPISLHPADPQFLTLLRVIYDQEFSWRFSKNLNYLLERVRQKHIKSQYYSTFLKRLVTSNLFEDYSREPS